MRGPLDRFLYSSPPANSREEKRAQPSGIRTNPSDSRSTVKTDHKTTSKTRNEFNPTLSRNHSYDKLWLPEAIVSRSVSARTAPSSEALGTGKSWRLRLQLKEDWNSQDSSVQELLGFLRNQKSGSLQSAQTHCWALDRMCRDSGIVPSKLVQLPRYEIEALVQRHCNGIIERSRRRGRSAKSANTELACLKTFFACNGFNKENGSELRVKGFHQPPRTVNTPEYIPTLGQALRMAERSGSKRDRAIVLTLICTGLRNSALRALKVGDILPELKEEKKTLLIKIDANWNDTRIPGSCKNCIPYHTFLAQIATEAIQSMLQEREIIFGSYSVEEPLFISNYNQIQLNQRRMKTLTSRQLQIIVHKAALAADIPQNNNVHVQSMRKVFESVLRSPLADGSAMDPKDQEFLMGHMLPGSQDHYYDPTKIEPMRELYSKLVFEDRPLGQELSLQTVRKMAEILGVDFLQVKAAKEKELGHPLSFKEEEEVLEQEIKLVRDTQNRQEQKIVAIGDLEDYIYSGWAFVSALPNGKAVISRKMQPQ